MNELTHHQGGYNPAQIITADPASVAAAEAAKQRTQAAYMVAMSRPRNTDAARQRILAACRRPIFAEKAEYSKPIGGGRVTGPSIRLAELALREWGNVMSDIQVVYEDNSTRRIKVYITDLETNAQFTKEVSISKTVERKNSKGRTVVSERVNSNGDKVYIVEATDDELLNKEAALISKALRNEGLRLIPGDIIEEALEVAAQTRSDRTKADPDAHRRKVLDSFASIGITPKDLAKYLGHDTANISPREIDDLRTVYQSIKDGEAKWSDYVAAPDTTETSAKDALAPKRKPAEKAAEPAPEPEAKPEKAKTRSEILADCMLREGVSDEQVRKQAIDASILPEDFGGSVLKASAEQIEGLITLLGGEEGGEK